MGRYDNIHGDEDQLEYIDSLIKELKEYDQEEQGVQEWKDSRED